VSLDKTLATDGGRNKELYRIEEQRVEMSLEDSIESNHGGSKGFPPLEGCT